MMMMTTEREEIVAAIAGGDTEAITLLLGAAFSRRFDRIMGPQPHGSGAALHARLREAFRQSYTDLLRDIPEAGPYISPVLKGFGDGNQGS